MTARPAAIDSGIGVSCIASTVVHLAVFLLLVWWGKLFPVNMNLQETYYVDVVNLPVASPQAGSPQQKGAEEEAALPPSKLQENQMAVPPAPRPEAAKPSDKTAVKATDQNDSAFAERMAKLEGKSEAKRQEAALERLRSKVTTAGSGRSGMPAATGKEVGSDFTAYVQSRLKDAFRETISYTSKNPEVVVRLFIDVNGRISKRKLERSSGDRAFELSVQRAIDMAGEKFTHPPDKKVFEGVFVFKPQGITSDRGK
ncbi:MAG: TonB C-terminal domain-containing protein [Deltaproteobacteria bacterium]|nr:TonB C-terminal domain-containing protein [Deltaproteobacteria bacterium]